MQERNWSVVLYWNFGNLKEVCNVSSASQLTSNNHGNFTFASTILYRLIAKEEVVIYFYETSEMFEKDAFQYILELETLTSSPPPPVGCEVHEVINMTNLLLRFKCITKAKSLVVTDSKRWDDAQMKLGKMCFEKRSTTGTEIGTEGKDLTALRVLQPNEIMVAIKKLRKEVFRFQRK